MNIYQLKKSEIKTAFNDDRLPPKNLHGQHIQLLN